MAKTNETLELEHEIYLATKKQGVFACFEVTIGWYGKERVDYLTYDTNGIWRCYEIKVSKADFHSSAAHTFCGHFNYYVMTIELYEQVKDEIPAHIGVYVGGNLKKRPKKQQLAVDEQVLKSSLIRSLSREVDKHYKSQDIEFVERLKRNISILEKDKNYYSSKYNKLYTSVYLKLGRQWIKDNCEEG